jgi:ATP-binding cassette subfamily F protein uup
LAELPSRIAALEAEQRAVSEQLADPLLYRSQALEVQRLSARLNEIDDELLTLLERWEALEA